MGIGTENGSFAGKVAFVTGAASGIGRATAIAFARAGADVVVADVTPHDNADTARAVESLGVRSLALKCDVTNSGDVDAAVKSTPQAFGRLDAAFNNAGIEQAPKPAAETSEEEWDQILAVNLRGVFLCMKHEILQRRHPRGPRCRDRPGADRTDGDSRRDRISRRLALLGRCRVRRGPRHGCGRRTDGLAPHHSFDSSPRPRFGGTEHDSEKAALACASVRECHPKITLQP
jgi:NAD(P)-dependent dehydrogenase (short-subunit alcohol dehydrogenase family)